MPFSIPAVAVVSTVMTLLPVVFPAACSAVEIWAGSSPMVV